MVQVTNPAFIKIFKKIDRGMDPFKAWESCGSPTTWGNFNRQLKARQAAAAPTPAAPPPSWSRKRAASAEPTTNRERACMQPTPAKPPSTVAGKRAEPASSMRTGPVVAKKVRKTMQQVEAVAANKAAYWQQYKAAHKGATLEYAKAVAAGMQRRKGCSLAEIATKWDNTLAPENKHRITERALSNWISQGKEPGTSPQVPGPKMGAMKRKIVDVVQSYARMQQLEGRSAKPKELLGKVTVVVDGTESEALIDSKSKRSRLLKALRAGPNALNATIGESIDKRRNDCLTKANLTEWFDGWEHFLVERGFGVWRDTPPALSNPYLKARIVYVSKQKRSRIINPDETHQVMTTQLEKGGPRAIVYCDLSLGASGREAIVNSRHTSAIYATNAAGEVLAPYYEFDSSSSSAAAASSSARGTASSTAEEEQSADLRWLLGLPRPRGYYGHSEMVTLQPGHEVSYKGGTISGSFINWMDTCIDPAYPNITPEWVYESEGEEDEVGEMPIKSGPIIIKTDHGPDRVDMDEEQLLKRKKRHEGGTLTYSGLPNGSAAQQEMDQLFGDFKQRCVETATLIVKEREQAAEAARKAKRLVAATIATNPTDNVDPQEQIKHTAMYLFL